MGALAPLAGFRPPYGQSGGGFAGFTPENQRAFCKMPPEQLPLVNLPLSNSGAGFALYCLGQGQLNSDTEACSILETQQSGDFAISLPTETAQALGVRAALNGNYNLSVIITGDDDPGPDCKHNGFEAQLNVGYIVLPEAEVLTLATGGGLI